MSAITIRDAVHAGADPAVAVDTALAAAAADRWGAVVRLHRDTAAAQVDQLRRRLAAGERPPLAGVPVLIKDNLCLRGQETTACSRILAGFRPPYTATAIERLLDAGAVIIGATNMDEFAMGGSTETGCYGPTRNPVDPERIAGGSSGGSAAAVAAGIVPLALGSDTGGSIRQPAALCGCVGLKPTYGRVSRHGLIAFGSSLDQIGPLAKDVADVALALHCLAAHDPLDSTSAPDAALGLDPPSGDPLTALAGLRIGHVPEHRTGLAPAVAATLERTLALLADHGAIPVEITMPHERYAVAVYYVLATGEAASNLSRYDGVRYGRQAVEAGDLADLYRRTRSTGFGEEVKRRIMLGTYVLSAGYVDAYYRQAQRVRRLIIGDYADAFRACDLILGPTCPTTAFRLGERLADPLQMYLFDVFTIGANLAGLPGLSLPCGADGDGLPVGLQLLAPQWQEVRLLRAATALERLVRP
jgi:aspartyl-tRNA(Asn)/glutamyl-tRNA(Gln) amidotransferase subunit A